MDFWREFFFNNAVGVILSTLKNSEAKEKGKRAFLKLRNSINNAFIGDKDFE